MKGSNAKNKKTNKPRKISKVQKGAKKKSSHMVSTKKQGANKTVKKVVPPKQASKTNLPIAKTSKTKEEIITLSTTNKIKPKKELPLNSLSKEKKIEKTIKKEEKLVPRIINETELEKELRQIYSIDNKNDIKNPKEEMQQENLQKEQFNLPKTETKKVELSDDFLNEEQAAKLKQDIKEIYEEENQKKSEKDFLSILVIVLTTIFTALAIFFLFLILYICEA